MKIYNAELIESVEAIDKKLNPYYWWQNQIRIFGFILQREGIREWGEGLVDYVNLTKNHLVIDKLVYNKPYILIRCASGQTSVKRFDTYEEATKAAEVIALNFNIRLIL